MKTFLLYIDLKHLNKVTMKNKYLLSWINDLYDQLKVEQVFLKIDLRLEYHQLRMREEDVQKIAYRTYYGHFEFLVMLFWANKWPNNVHRFDEPSFLTIVGQICGSVNWWCLVYSKNQTNQEQHLKMVLRVLREIRLYTKLNKREFWLNKVIFLRHVISSEGIYVDPNKV